MNLEQMQYIAEVDRTHSISLAAENLHISQAAISQSIALLEKEIGVVIFKRSRLGTTSTNEGKQIIRIANEILNKVNEIRDEAMYLNSSYSGELVIASIPSLFITLLPQVLSKFKSDFPKVKLTIREVGSKEITEGVLKDEVDIGLVILSDEMNYKASRSLTIESLLEGKMNVCVSKNSPLASKDKLKVKDLKHHPLVIYSGQNWNSYIDSYEQSVGLFNVLCTTDNSEAIKRMIAENLAISLLTDVMLLNDAYVKNGDIVAIPLIDYKPETIQFSVVYSKSGKEKLIQKFLEYLKESSKELML
ncbi:LysR family transcriptional regulator [Priestia megaterium]|uniref:LysR family transcriptional regulator n=1 Tax=Priestia megaterium TaxID=1404 RepID=UPI0023DCBA7F|nr:LysR family transcriptional regulator [Priestia megaterium]MDF1964696.1 LysR family transcriptional regulator [Priestia megaterium]